MVDIWAVPSAHEPGARVSWDAPGFKVVVVVDEWTDTAEAGATAPKMAIGAITIEAAIRAVRTVGSLNSFFITYTWGIGVDTSNRTRSTAAADAAGSPCGTGGCYMPYLVPMSNGTQVPSGEGKGTPTASASSGVAA